MKPLYAIVTFHLKDGREIIDESMALRSISEKEFTMFSNKKMPSNQDLIDFATVSMLYGNSSRLLFSVDTKEIHTNEIPGRIGYTFNAPVDKKIILGQKELVISCQAYEKLRSMLRPRTGRVVSEDEEVIVFEI